jgi:Glyoxalase-like domain
MNSLVRVTIECVDIDRVAEFWGRVLRVDAIAAPSSDSRVVELDKGGRTVFLVLRRVRAPKMGENRIRLGLRTSDLESETARMLGLGAIRISNHSNGSREATMADVEGNEFDVIAES